MATALPPRPHGDVSGTWAAIGRLEGYRGGLRMINTSLGTLMSGASGLDGLFLIGLTGYRVGAMAEVDVVIAGVDSAIVQLRAGVRRLEHDLRTWQAACDRIRAANAAAARP